MAARINDVCDAVVAAIKAYWSGLSPTAGQMGPADSVSRAYEPDFNERPQEAGPRPAGRAVYVFPDNSVHHGMMDRATDDDEHALVVATFEWFADSGVPTVAWLDVRTAFTEALWKLLRNVRDPTIVPGSRAESADVSDWYDPIMLRENRAYLSFVRVSYREIASPSPGTD